MTFLPAFIAKRLSQKDSTGFSGPVVRIAVTAIALGLSVMILSVAVLVGFQTEIRDKVTGFAAHITISGFDDNASYESAPVTLEDDDYRSIAENPSVLHIQSFALKAGMIKTDEQMQGVVLKGAGLQYDWGFFRENLLEGNVPVVTDTGSSDEIIISSAIAQKLTLKTGDETRMYFITGPGYQPRGRKFIIAGIYETGLEEFDQVYVMGDIRHIQKLNGWTPDQVSGYEIFLKDFNSLSHVSAEIYQSIPFHLNVETVIGAYPQIFDWLRLMDANVVIILVLMILVSGITIVSTLLILILERTTMIGTLKSLGMNNRDLKLLFLYFFSRILIRGMILGNIIGLGLGYLQFYTRILPLDQDSYYMSYVPVSMDLFAIILVNAGTFLISLLMVMVPGYVIGRISPVRAIRFG